MNCLLLLLLYRNLFYCLVPVGVVFPDFYCYHSIYIRAGNLAAVGSRRQQNLTNQGRLGALTVIHRSFNFRSARCLYSHTVVFNRNINVFLVYSWSINVDHKHIFFFTDIHQSRALTLIFPSITLCTPLRGTLSCLAE